MRVGGGCFPHVSQYLSHERPIRQGAQGPGYLLKVIGQAVQLSSQTANSTFNEVVQQRLFMSHTIQLSLPLFLMMQKMKLPSQEDKYKE